jgi:hypothetical protein
MLQKIRANCEKEILACRVSRAKLTGYARGAFAIGFTAYLALHSNTQCRIPIGKEFCPTREIIACCMRRFATKNSVELILDFLRDCEQYLCRG